MSHPVHPLVRPSNSPPSPPHLGRRVVAQIFPRRPRFAVGQSTVTSPPFRDRQALDVRPGVPSAGRRLSRERKGNCPTFKAAEYLGCRASMRAQAKTRTPRALDVSLLLQPQSWSQWAPSVSAVQAVGWLSQAQLLTSRRLETWARVHRSSHIQERRRRHSRTGDSRHVEALSLRESCTLNNPVHDHLQTIYTLASS